MNKLLILCSALALSACVVPHPYTSTEYQKYKQSDLKIPNQPYPIRLEGEFERNGKSFPKANPALTKAAKIALNGTKIVTNRSDFWISRQYSSGLLSILL